MENEKFFRNGKILFRKDNVTVILSSININKYSKVNCTLNRVYKIHEVSSFYPL